MMESIDPHEEARRAHSERLLAHYDTVIADCESAKRRVLEGNLHMTPLPIRKRPKKQREKLPQVHVNLLVDSFSELYEQCQLDADLRPRINRLLAGDLTVDVAASLLRRYLMGAFD